MALAETQPGLVAVAEENGAGQSNVMPSQGQTAWPGAEHWCEAELSSMPRPSGTTQTLHNLSIHWPCPCEAHRTGRDRK